MPRILLVVAVACLLVALLPLPYAYYTFLRIFCFGIFVWAAFVSLEQRRFVPVVLFLGLAVLFNPFFKIYLDRAVWTGIDLVGCAGLTLFRTALTEYVNE